MFHDRPPARTSIKPLDLIRTPQGTKLVAYLTCEAPVAAKTHYYGGRTIPCTGEFCRACVSKIGSRWHVYVSLAIIGENRHVIHECTDDAAVPIYQWLDAGNKLRNTRWASFRSNRKSNGPVIIHLFPADAQLVFIPPAPEIEAILMRIWRVSGSSEEAHEPERTKHIAEVLADREQQLHRSNGHGKATSVPPPEVGGPQRPR